MIYQVALAVVSIVLIFALLWGGGVYFEREEAREEAKEIREDLEETRSSREMWRARANAITADRDTIAVERSEMLAERDVWAQKAVDFKRCFESAEKERDAYKRAKAESDERSVRLMIERDTAQAERDSIKASYTEALCKITDLDNLVCRIENAPPLDDVKGSYRLTAIRGPYKKTRERLARRASRLGRVSLAASLRRKATAS